MGFNLIHNKIMELLKSKNTCK